MYKLIIFIILLLPVVVYSQAAQEWVSRYEGLGGNVVDQPHSLAVDNSGNVYVTGGSAGSGTGSDYATIKYNSAGVQQWAARYNGPGNSNDEAYSIATDVSGNVYVTGISFGVSEDYATIKYNSSGIQQWVARYDGPGSSSDGATSITIDISGNLYVTGYSYGNGTGYDYATIKYNSAGVQLWAARYNGPIGFTGDLARAIKVDVSGNVYVTGNSLGNADDYATIKYNSSGVQQWAARYNGPGNFTDVALDLVIDGTGNVYVTGYSNGSGTANDCATIKYNSSGVQQWAARYNGPGNSSDEGRSIAIDASGNVYIAGGSVGSGTGPDYATIKYNSSGTQQWVARYNGPANSNDLAYSIAVYNTDNIYVTGYSEGSGGNNDYVTVKYNLSGIQQWETRYNGPGNGYDLAGSVEVDASGNLYITGYSTGSGTSYDFATIKYHDQALPVEISYFNSSVESNNVLLNWGTVWELNNSGFEIERSIITGIEAGEWKKVGFINGNGTTSEVRHYKLEDRKLAAGVYKYRLKQIDYNGNYEYHYLQNDETIGTPKVFEVSQNYPNPSNPKTKIDFQIPIDGNISLRVYDISGKEIAMLVDGFKTADFYSVEFDGSDLGSGIYFYRIIAIGLDGFFSKTMKMVLVK